MDITADAIDDLRNEYASDNEIRARLGTRPGTYQDWLERQIVHLRRETESKSEED